MRLRIFVCAPLTKLSRPKNKRYERQSIKTCLFLTHWLGKPYQYNVSLLIDIQLSLLTLRSQLYVVDLLYCTGLYYCHFCCHKLCDYEIHMPYQCCCASILQVGVCIIIIFTYLGASRYCVTSFFNNIIHIVHFLPPKLKFLIRRRIAMSEYCYEDD